MAAHSAIHTTWQVPSIAGVCLRLLCFGSGIAGRFIRTTWKRPLVIHVIASSVLMAAGVFGEAGVAWLPDRATWNFSDALLHYFRHHAQISILTYWGLLGAHHLYRVLDRAHQRELDAAQLEGQLAEAKL